MTIEIAKELKAIEIGYTDWRSLELTYNRYTSKQHHVKEYEDIAKMWTQTGIPKDSLERIHHNIYSFSERYITSINERFAYLKDNEITNPEKVKLINIINNIL